MSACPYNPNFYSEEDEALMWEYCEERKIKAKKEEKRKRKEAREKKDIETKNVLEAADYSSIDVEEEEAILSTAKTEAILPTAKTWADILKNKK